MKIVIVMDSFKGSLSSMQAGAAARAGVLRAHPGAQVVVMPLADGGEGTADALIEGMGAERVELTVTGPLGTPVRAVYGYQHREKTAVIEMASAAGITLVEKGKLDPLSATTYGVGEMILDALARGCEHYIIGLGGSATNDGGIGMLTALGYVFRDEAGDPVASGARGLSKIASIDARNVPERLKACTFRAACDVKNPLCGENGATYVYGPQKGVSEQTKPQLDAALAHFARCTEEWCGRKTAHMPGAGAAGGMGFALVSYLDARLLSGIGLVLDVIGLEKELSGADYVITGEGRMDGQTAMGKAPVGVAALAKRHGVKVLAFAGGVTRDARGCNDAGIDAFFPIVRGVCTLEEAVQPENARENLCDAVEQVFRLL